MRLILRTAAVCYLAGWTLGLTAAALAWAHTEHPRHRLHRIDT